MAVGAPAQRAPTTIASYTGLLLSLLDRSGGPSPHQYTAFRVARPGTKFLTFGNQARPLRIAKATAAARLSAPVFVKIVVMWLATVLLLSASSAPISRLLLPAAISRSTSASRSVRPAG